MELQLNMLIVLVLVMSFAQQTSTKGSQQISVVADNCTPDQYGRYAALEACIRDGIKILSDFARRIEKKLNIDVCRRISDTQKCFEEMTSACPRASNRLRKHWTPLIRHFDCFCHSNNDACRRDFNCIQNELSGKLSLHCNDMHSFNIKQNTKSPCFFAQEMSSCKVALVNSSCGESAGHVVYHLSSILIASQQSTSTCNIAYDTSYKGFHFHADCPSFFPHDMANCAHEELRGQFLPFNPDNVLIANAKGHQIKEACSSYRQYKLCMRPKKKACPQGNALLRDIDHQLRIYLLKMEFICDRQNRHEYSSKISCFHRIQDNNLLHSCGLLWLDIWPDLNAITAHDFYCNHHLKSTHKIRNRLRDIQTCYKTVYSSNCGAESGHLMENFVNVAFSDPYFLRFDFKPNCPLHSDDASFVTKPDHVTPYSTRASHSSNTPESATASTSSPRTHSTDNGSETIDDSAASALSPALTVCVLWIIVLWCL